MRKNRHRTSDILRYSEAICLRSCLCIVLQLACHSIIMLLGQDTAAILSNSCKSDGQTDGRTPPLKERSENAKGKKTSMDN